MSSALYFLEKRRSLMSRLVILFLMLSVLWTGASHAETQVPASVQQIRVSALAVCPTRERLSDTTCVQE